VIVKDRTLYQPKEVHHLHETGLSLSLVLDLVLKYTYFEGAMTLAKMVQRSKLSSTIIHAMYRHLQKATTLRYPRHGRRRLRNFAQQQGPRHGGSGAQEKPLCRAGARPAGGL
jgi:hypothetical protein